MSELIFSVLDQSCFEGADLNSRKSQIQVNFIFLNYIFRCEASLWITHVRLYLFMSPFSVQQVLPQVHLNDNVKSIKRSTTKSLKISAQKISQKISENLSKYFQKISSNCFQKKLSNQFQKTQNIFKKTISKFVLRKTRNIFKKIS